MSAPNHDDGTDRGEEGPLEDLAECVKKIRDPDARVDVISYLCRNKHRYPDMAKEVWNSQGIAVILLLEVLNMYLRRDFLDAPGLLKEPEVRRACNALSLFQVIATHPETHEDFLRCGFPLHIYPFLSNDYKTRHYEFLRLNTLGVIGDMMRQNELAPVVRFLISTDFVMYNLRIMQLGMETSGTMATFIMSRILVDRDGFIFLTSSMDRTRNLIFVLNRVIQFVAEHRSARLMRLALKCYERLSQDQETLSVLRMYFPPAIIYRAVCEVAQIDADLRMSMENLFQKVGLPLPIHFLPAFISLTPSWQMAIPSIGPSIPRRPMPTPPKAPPTMTTPMTAPLTTAPLTTAPPTTTTPMTPPASTGPATTPSTAPATMSSTALATTTPPPTTPLVPKKILRNPRSLARGNNGAGPSTAGPSTATTSGDVGCSLSSTQAASPGASSTVSDNVSRERSVGMRDLLNPDRPFQVSCPELELIRDVNDPQVPRRDEMRYSGDGDKALTLAELSARDGPAGGLVQAEALVQAEGEDGEDNKENVSRNNVGRTAEGTRQNVRDEEEVLIAMRYARDLGMLFGALY